MENKVHKRNEFYGSSASELIKEGLADDNKKNISMARNYQTVQLGLNELSKKMKEVGEEVTASAVLELSSRLEKLYSIIGSE